MSVFFNNIKAELFGIDDIMKSKKKSVTIDSEVVEKSMQEHSHIIESGMNKQEKLDALKKSFADCNKCILASSRTNIVFGEGNPDAELMFIGEGPGAKEDETGRPFVGRSGTLLTQMITAMGIKREDVYIANIVKCRPPENRDPQMDEALSCIGYLRTQIQIINPKYIVCLGSVSLNFLLQPVIGGAEKLSISKYRGNWQDFYGYKVMPTFHPSYLLHNPGKKKEVWLDLQLVMKEMGLPLPNKQG